MIAVAQPRMHGSGDDNAAAVVRGIGAAACGRRAKHTPSPPQSARRPSMPGAAWCIATGRKDAQLGASVFLSPQGGALLQLPLSRAGRGVFTPGEAAYDGLDDPLPSPPVEH